jgi:hypothetical protein
LPDDRLLRKLKFEVDKNEVFMVNGKGDAIVMKIVEIEE